MLTIKTNEIEFLAIEGGGGKGLEPCQKIGV